MKRLLLGIILVLAFSCAPKKLVEFGFISFYYGDVIVELDGKKTKPKLKMILHSGDEIETGKNARVDIQLPNFGIIRVNQNSELELEKVITDVNQAITAGLDKGQILCKLKKVKKGDEFKVETPTAVAGIRGTTFLVESDEENKKSEIAVTEGSVEVVNKKDPEKKKTVKQNETAEVSTKDKVMKVVKGIDTKKLKELKVLKNVKTFKDIKSVKVDSLKKMSFKNLKDLNIKDTKGLGDEFKSLIGGKKSGTKGPSKTEKKINDAKTKADNVKADAEKKKEELEKKKQELEEQKKKMEEQKKKAEEEAKKAKDKLKGLGF